jgi:hypothetical protein
VRIDTGMAVSWEDNSVMKVLWILLMSIISFFFTSCEKDDPKLPEGADRLIGEWRWLSSSGGMAGGQLFPEHPDDRMLKFMSNGSYFCNCEPAVGTFSIGEPEWPMFEHRIFYTQIPDTHRMSDVQDARFLSADTLILTDACRDCYMHTYVRVR